jgi:hypothetical protein
MTVITLTAAQFADKMRSEDMVMLPVAVQGFVYGVVRGAQDKDIYRVAVV